MRIIVLVIAIIEAASYNLTYQQFLNSTPSQFGVLTVTHARNGNYSYFQKHLDRYASMQCPQMMEIAVAWNNDVSPEEAGFTTKQSWKRPVYFVKTPYNSMDFRYMLSQDSKAQVYFSMDDDVSTNCKELRKSFSEWKKHAVGDIAPILSYEPRSFNFEAQNSTYKYIMGKKFPTYFLTLTGVAWIPRTYLQLYYSSFKLVQELRDQVRQKNNCDDILMNYIANYYFPQFVSRTFNYSLKMFNLPGSQSTTNIHKKIRQGCLERFSQILGFNPLRGVSLHHTDRADLYLSEVNKYALYLRRYEIGQLIEWEIQSGQKQNFILGNMSNVIDESNKFQFKSPWMDVKSGEQLQQKDRVIKQKQEIIKQLNKQIEQKMAQIDTLSKKAQQTKLSFQQNEEKTKQAVKDKQIELKDQSIQKSPQDMQGSKQKIDQKERKIEKENIEMEVREKSRTRLQQDIKNATFLLIVMLVVLILVIIFPLLKHCTCLRKKNSQFEQVQAVNMQSQL